MGDDNDSSVRKPDETKLSVCTATRDEGAEFPEEQGQKNGVPRAPGRIGRERARMSVSHRKTDLERVLETVLKPLFDGAFLERARQLALSSEQDVHNFSMSATHTHIRDSGPFVSRREREISEMLDDLGGSRLEVSLALRDVATTRREGQHEKAALVINKSISVLSFIKGITRYLAAPPPERPSRVTVSIWEKHTLRM